MIQESYSMFTTLQSQSRSNFEPCPQAMRSLDPPHDAEERAPTWSSSETHSRIK